MLDTVARLFLSPVLLAQALSVRRSAQSLPEAAGPRDGSLGSGPSLRLRIIGDSSGAGVGVADQQNALAGQLAKSLATAFSVSWHLDAITGATTGSTLQRLAAAPPESTDIVVVALGVNDVTRLVPTRIWVRQQKSLFERINALYAPRRIYLSGMPPLEHFPLLPNPLRWTLARHAQKLERALQASLTKTPQVAYMPFTITPEPQLMARDGFHPSATLYAIWAKQMASRIISDWPEQ
jgi:lysophospholipase L1-like esterase